MNSANTNKNITTDLKVEQSKEQPKTNEKKEPVCSNGVCELTWKPKRPKAA